MTDKPVFEVRSGGKVYKVYANGKTEGFGEDTFVINSIPLLIRQAEARGCAEGSKHCPQIVRDAATAAREQ